MDCKRRKSMKVLLTGGLGYIGSHTAVELLCAGYDVVVVDNLSNSDLSVKDRIVQIVEQKFKINEGNFKVYVGDVRDEKLLNRVFKENKINSVIHFAGLKAVGESTQKPLEYYDNNLISTLKLLQAMRKFNVKNFVFSSSATVYGQAKSMPIYEDFEVGATNPYGRTKLFIEEILKDFYASDKTYNIAILRYFNPIGAHDSGLIGEDPNGIPNNLFPYISRVATGRLECLSVFGNDYNTPDGTGVRDYIHVVDLAKGHLSALKKLETNCGLKIYNLGTGKGYSVLEIVDAYNKICGGKVKYKIAPRRPGDIDICYASAEKAYRELGWRAERDLENMCKTGYNFECKKAEATTKDNKK